jgi:hypothetical protein
VKIFFVGIVSICSEIEGLDITMLGLVWVDARIGDLLVMNFFEI